MFQKLSNLLKLLALLTRITLFLSCSELFLSVIVVIQLSKFQAGKVFRIRINFHNRIKRVISLFLFYNLGDSDVDGIARAS